MSENLADLVVMVEPTSFGYNSQTARTNLFQVKPTESEQRIRSHAMSEFQNMVSLLRKNSIDVITMPSPSERIVPDAVFPNNWFSVHDGGTLVVYPMLAQNRREEKQPDTLKNILEKKVQIQNLHDYSQFEDKNLFLEGTGSLVLDRVHKVALAVLSPRTDITVLEQWGKDMGYKTIAFHAHGLTGQMPIYHTNVLMSIGNGFCVIGLDAITDSRERSAVESEIKNLNHHMIDISLQQVHAFCGNIIAVNDTNNHVKIIMSKTAFDAFSDSQKAELSSFGELVPVSIPTIESIGGGSARCMIAEIFS